MSKAKRLTLRESLARWLSGESRISTGPYIGRNDRTHVRRQKWEPKLSLEGHQILPSGAIVNRVLLVAPKKDKANTAKR